MSSAVLLPNRHTLRKGDGAAKVAALLAFPDEGGGSGQGQDGMVVWAADNAIHLSLPSNKVRRVCAGFCKFVWGRFSVGAREAQPWCGRSISDCSAYTAVWMPAAAAFSTGAARGRCAK